MELKTPMVFVKHITAAQRGNASSIQYLCDHTSGQFVKICREYDLTNAEIEAVLAKAYGNIFANIKSVKNPQNFMSWAGNMVDEYCRDIKGDRAAAPAAKPAASETAPAESAATVKPTVSEAAPVVSEPAPAAPEPVPVAPVPVPAAPVPVPVAPVPVPAAPEPVPVAPVPVPAAPVPAPVAPVPVPAASAGEKKISAETVPADSGMTEDQLIGIMKKWAEQGSRKAAPYAEKVNAQLEKAEDKIPELPKETVIETSAADGTAAPAAALSESPSVSDGTPSAAPTAFYDENAYAEPAAVFNADLNYADETSETPAKTDNRIIPVDELVYHPHANYFSSDEPGTQPNYDLPEVKADETAQPEYEAYEIPEEPVAPATDFAGEYKSPAESADVTGPAPSEDAVRTESTPAEIAGMAGPSPAETAAWAPTEPAASVKPAFQSKVISSLDELAALRAADEPDINLIEEEEPKAPEAVSDSANEAKIDVADGLSEDDTTDIIKDEDTDILDDEDTDIIEDEDTDLLDDDDDDDDMDDEEIHSGLAFRTKVLIGLLCVFVFGACIGIGYAISKGMTSGGSDTSSSQGFVESQTETDAESVTDTESLVESLMESVAESLTVSDASSAAESVQTESAASGETESTSGTTSSSGSSQTTGSGTQTAGEVTARPDLAKYLGGTFAAVFRDYPDIPHSVYRGELSLANEYIGFLGSYDATKPVSSTLVESVSLLGEAENFNINGFYVGMSAKDAESLASAGGYLETDLSADSSREYEDIDGNILTLTIEAGLVRNVTLRMSSSDEVAIAAADDIAVQTADGEAAQAGGTRNIQEADTAQADDPLEDIAMPEITADGYDVNEEDENGGVG